VPGLPALVDPGGQGGKELARLDIREHLTGELDVVKADFDRPVGIEVRRERATIEVRHHRADGYDDIAGLDEFAHRLIHQSSVVHPDVGGLALLQNRFVAKHRREGEPRCIDEGLELRAEACPGGDDSGQDAGRRGPIDRLDDGVNGRGQAVGVARGRSERSGLREHGLYRDVGGEGHIHRPTVIKGCGDQALGL
jgi:hypothetical protein